PGLQVFGQKHDSHAARAEPQENATRTEASQFIRSLGRRQKVVKYFCVSHDGQVGIAAARNTDSNARVPAPGKPAQAQAEGFDGPALRHPAAEHRRLAQRRDQVILAGQACTNSVTGWTGAYMVFPHGRLRIWNEPKKEAFKFERGRAPRLVQHGWLPRGTKEK